MAATTVSYQCLNCGAPLEFAPGQEKLKCEYCDTEFDIKTLEDFYAQKEEKAAQERAAKEVKWDTQAAGEEWDPDEAAMMKAFTCSACGAEIVCDENTMATECCYCGNPSMLPSRFTGMLKPDFVIPFEKTKEEAVAALKSFCEGKRLLPDTFIANNRVEDIQAMYVPFWLFDSEVQAYGYYTAEDDAVTTTKEATITVTSHFRVDRECHMAFERVPVDGSSKMDDDYMDSIEPYDYSKLVPFTTSYLAGYLADKYDVDAEASVERADKRVAYTAESEMENTITGYTRFHKEQVSIVKDGGTVSYALVPVWILTTRYQNKSYTFMMNGQTGKFIGSLPVDEGKAKKYLAGASVILLPIMYYICKFIANMFM